MKRVVRAIAAVCGAVSCLVAQAATVTIAEQLPDMVSLAGVQSQSGANLDPAGLTGIAPGYAGYRLEVIEWWGYDLANPGNAAAPFEVTFNGALVGGVLTRSDAGMLASVPGTQPDTALFLYSLDLDDGIVVPVAAANNLALWNADLFSDWYWQTSGSGDIGDMAFRLIAAERDDNTVPEPGSLALLAAAGFGLAASTRRMKAPNSAR